LIRAMFDVEPLDEDLAKIAGEALASLRRGGDVDASVTIDAIVIASTARRGDVVFTSDVDDLGRFSRFFPNVRVFSV
jgi:predicted nucleic acid-binding protein